MPRLLELSTRHPVVLAAASPPDRAGYFSLGTNADYVASLIGKVPFFLEVNERMPRTFGLNQIHASQLLGYCVVDRPLVEVPPATPDERDRAIAAPDRRARPRRRDAAGRHRRRPQRGARGAAAAIATSASTPSCSPTGSSTSSRPASPPACASSCAATRSRRRSASAPSGSTTGCTTTARSSCCPSTWSTTRGGSPARTTSSRSTPRRRSTSTASARRRRSPGATGPRAAARPTSRAARCTRPRGQAFIVLHSTTSKGRSRIRARLTEGSVVTTLKNTVDNVVTEFGIAQLRGALAGRARAPADRRRAPRSSRAARARGARGGDPARRRLRGRAGRAPRARDRADGLAACSSRSTWRCATGRPSACARCARTISAGCESCWPGCRRTRAGCASCPRASTSTGWPRRRRRPATGSGSSSPPASPERIVAHAMYLRETPTARGGRLRGRRRLARPRDRHDPARAPRRRGRARRRGDVRRLRAPVQPPHGRRVPRVRIPRRGPRLYG